MQLLSKAMLHFVHQSAVTFNTKDYNLFLFEDIFQISVKKNIYQSYPVYYLRRYSYKYLQ